MGLGLVLVEFGVLSERRNHSELPNTSNHGHGHHPEKAAKNSTVCNTMDRSCLVGSPLMARARSYVVGIFSLVRSYLVGSLLMKCMG